MNKNKIEIKFLILTLLCSIPLYGLNIIYPKGIFLNLPLSVVMIFVPCFLGMYFINKESGTKSLKDWFLNVFSYKSNKIQEIILSFIIIPVCVILAALIKNPNYISNLNGYSFDFYYAIRLFIIFFFGAILEELGWTSYLTKGMQEKYGVFISGLMIGLVWGLWHLIPYISQGRDAVSITFLIYNAVIYRIIMGYLYKGSNYSGLTATIFHTMINLVPEIIPLKYEAFEFYNLSITLTLVMIRIIYKSKNSYSV